MVSVFLAPVAVVSIPLGTVGIFRDEEIPKHVFLRKQNETVGPGLFVDGCDMSSPSSEQPT